MTGPQISEESFPSDAEHDIAGMISDWLMSQNGSPTENFSDPHTVIYGGCVDFFAREFRSQSEAKVDDLHVED